jgi:hypothetical protein
MIDAVLLRESLTRSGAALRAVATGVTPEEARWRPAAEDWSVLEVVNHLWDEEREDFRTRLDITLRAGDERWPGIHPSRWVLERKYNERDIAESLAGFLAERELSIKWLDSLQDADAARTYTESDRSMTAGDLMASWAAHDLLHLRQLTELRYAWLLDKAAPYGPGYAGEW